MSVVEENFLIVRPFFSIIGAFFLDDGEKSFRFEENSSDDEEIFLNFKAFSSIFEAFGLKDRCLESAERRFSRSNGNKY